MKINVQRHQLKLQNKKRRGDKNEKNKIMFSFRFDCIQVFYCHYHFHHQK